jgi:MinD-like ATPase involved in chromosome partitioning or flagellar assembly
MNTYRYTFAAVCPADGELIIYQLEVKSLSMIHAEHIKTATALIKNGWHEEIADRLAETLGGDQIIIATHQGVEIETVRLSR